MTGRTDEGQSRRIAWEVCPSEASSPERCQDHKGWKSRDNHRYAIVVQDLATQWIQCDPCKTKTSQETEKSLFKFLEPSQAPKVVLYIQTTRWSLANLVKIYHGIIELQGLIDPRQMASLTEPFEEQKKVLQQYCYKQDWMKGGGQTMERYCYLRNVQDLLGRRENAM